MESINSETVDKLAKLFGATTNQIIENTTIFLSKYGWYITIRHICIIPVIAGIVAFIGALLFLIITDTCCLDESKYKITKIAFIIFIVVTMILLIDSFVPLLIAPELVGLEYLK